MFSSLRSGEIDGVLMDKFRSPEVLHATKDRNFRVFSGYDANVPYYLAVHNSLRSLFEGASCIKNRINNQDLENLFIKYLMPVVVITQLLAETLTCYRYPCTLFDCFCLFVLLISYFFFRALITWTYSNRLFPSSKRSYF